MNANFCDFSNRHCRPCEGGLPAIPTDRAQNMLVSVPGWQLIDNRLCKTFKFANHFETMAFVNAVAWVSHSENHHPEVTFGYADCTIRYWTHAIDGLTENDFICAAKLERMLDL